MREEVSLQRPLKGIPFFSKRFRGSKGQQQIREKLTNQTSSSTNNKRDLLYVN